MSEIGKYLDHNFKGAVLQVNEGFTNTAVFGVNFEKGVLDWENEEKVASLGYRK